MLTKARKLLVHWFPVRRWDDRRPAWYTLAVVRRSVWELKAPAKVCGRWTRVPMVRIERDHSHGMVRVESPYLRALKVWATSRCPACGERFGFLEPATYLEPYGPEGLRPAGFVDRPDLSKLRPHHAGCVPKAAAVGPVATSPPPDVAVAIATGREYRAAEDTRRGAAVALRNRSCSHPVGRLAWGAVRLWKRAWLRATGRGPK